MIKQVILGVSICAIIFSGCGKSKANRDTVTSTDSLAAVETTANAVIDSSASQTGVAEEQLPDEEMLKSRIKAIWKALPMEEGMERGVRTAFSESFASAYLGMVERIKSIEKQMGDRYYNDEDAMMTDGEMIYSWYGAQDPDPNGKFVMFKFTDVTPTAANVTVKRMNGPETETFRLKLKLENGKWMLDDFKSEHQYGWSKASFNSYRR